MKTFIRPRALRLIRTLAVAVLLAATALPAAASPGGGEPKSSPATPASQQARPLNLTEVARQMSYPAILAKSNIRGTVKVKLHLDTTGAVTKTEILASEHTLLSQECLKAVAQIQFLPARSQGVAVPAIVIIPFHFGSGRSY